MFIKINDTLYEAELRFISCDMWENRNVCEISMKCDYDTAELIFEDDMEWGYDMTTTGGTTEYYSLNDYSIRGPITVYEDHCVIKMGKLTEDELIAPVLEMGTLAMEVGITIDTKPAIQDNEALEPYLDGTVIRWTVVTLPDPDPNPDTIIVPPASPVITE